MNIYHGERLRAEEQTILQAIASSFEAHPDAPALRYPSNGQYVDLDYGELKNRVGRLAGALMSRGLQRGDKALIMSDTRYEWMLGDLAVLFAGGVTVTAFPTIPAHLLRHHIKDSDSKILFLEGREQLRKFEELDEDLRQRDVVLFDEVRRVPTLDSLLTRDPRPEDRVSLEGNVREIGPADVASLIYTSGTTGIPKGALLTQWNIASAALSGLQVLGAEPGHTVVAFLPLAHIYQRLVCLGMLMIGGCVAFSNPRTLAHDLLTIKPDHMAAVPRLYERVHKRILEEVERQSPTRRRMYHWAESIALEFSEALRTGLRPSTGLRVKHRVADWLVYRRIRSRLGGNLKYAMSGASALSPRLCSLFNGMGIHVLEGYGLTETAAPANLNPPDMNRPGTVGPPIPGVRETLADDKEILIKGPNVFVGYHNMPEETKEAFTEDGWFRSGDLGEFDEDGYLRILGRKKQILVLSTGKKVAPRPIEEALRSSAWVEDCMLLGDARKFTAALIQPQFERLVEFAGSKGMPVEEESLVYGSGPAGERLIRKVPEGIVRRSEVHSLFEGLVEEVNKDLDYHEKIKKFIVLSRAFGEEKDEVTPTLKKKREAIEANLKDRIDVLYA